MLHFNKKNTFFLKIGLKIKKTAINTSSRREYFKM